MTDIRLRPFLANHSTVWLLILLACASQVHSQEPGTFELTPTRDLSLVPTPLRGPVGEGPQDIILNMPAGFNATIFSADPRLSGPRFMDFDAAGVLHVATMRGPSEVLALPDRDGDGVADEARVVARGFRYLHSIAFYDGALYAADTDRLLRLTDADDDGFYEVREELAPLPSDDADLHPPRTIVIDDREKIIYINVGSSCDLCRERDTERAAVLAFDIDGSNRRVFASGLRNAVGLNLHPVTNELWGVVNGHDREGDSLPPERIDIIREGGFYGWPFAYAYQTWVDFSIPQYAAAVLPMNVRDSLLVARMPPPVALAPARLAPMGIHFYTGHRFPSTYRNAAFISFRAGHNAAVPGWKVVVLFVDPDGANAEIADFMTGLGPLVKDPNAFPGDGVHGQPVGLISDENGNLYVTSDFVNNMVVRVTYESADATAIKEVQQLTPAVSRLGPNYPNPFNAETAIPYSLSSRALVELSIFDVSGRRIRLLYRGSQMAGNYTARWDGRDDRTMEAASGIYFCRLHVVGRGVDQTTMTRKLLLLQ